MDCPPIHRRGWSSMFARKITMAQKSLGFAGSPSAPRGIICRVPLTRDPSNIEISSTSQAKCTNLTANLSKLKG